MSVYCKFRSPYLDSTFTLCQFIVNTCMSPYLDSTFTLHQFIANICRSPYLELSVNNCICNLLSDESIIFIHSLVQFSFYVMSICNLVCIVCYCTCIYLFCNCVLLFDYSFVKCLEFCFLLKTKTKSNKSVLLFTITTTGLIDL